MVLRAQHFVVDRELQLQTHRGLLKSDIIWNTETGLAQTPSRLAWAERERAAFYRRMVEMFARFDIFVTPSAATPAFDVDLRHPEYVDGEKLTNYMGASTLNAAITLTSCPAVAVPCGFDRFGRPVGLQIAAPIRGEAVALGAAALFEQVTGAGPAAADRSAPGDGARPARGVRVHYDVIRSVCYETAEKQMHQYGLVITARVRNQEGRRSGVELGDAWEIHDAVPADSKLEAAAVEALAHAFMKEHEGWRLSKKGKNRQIFKCSPEEAHKAVVRASDIVRSALGLPPAREPSGDPTSKPPSRNKRSPSSPTRQDLPATSTSQSQWGSTQPSSSSTVSPTPRTTATPS